MKKILFVAILSISTFSLEVKREDTSTMIDSMVKKGLFTKEQAAAAKQKLAGLSDQQWQQVQIQGAQMAEKLKNNNPNVGNDVDSASSNIDFNSKEFKNLQEKLSGAMKVK